MIRLARIWLANRLLGLALLAMPEVRLYAKVGSSLQVGGGQLDLDKREIARRQLGTALALFIDDADPVSVHTLACGGGEIAEHLTVKAGATPFSTHALATFPDLDINSIRRVRNQYWNAFKHAATQKNVERNDQALLERFTDQVNDHTLFIGWYDYGLAVGALPIEAQAFQAWYFALYPEKLNRENDPKLFRQVFPTINEEKSRSGQKRALRAAIAKHRLDKEIMGDPRTDPNPLIL